MNDGSKTKIQRSYSRDNYKKDKIGDEFRLPPCNPKLNFLSLNSHQEKNSTVWKDKEE